MIILKLGGSLYDQPELLDWLRALNDATLPPLLIVPGGGPFADLVRRAQKQHQFDDSTAHHMAMMAMAQFGLLLKSKLPSCEVVSTIESINHTSALSIWLPTLTDPILNASGLEHSWNITSDSLALWLAQYVKATKLILVKSVSIASNSSLSSLSTSGIIDSGFIKRYEQQAIACSVIDVSQHHLLFELADLPELPLSNQ